MSSRVSTSSPSRPPPVQQTQRTQHQRSQQPTRMRLAHNTPGIITLPQAKLGESGPSSASSASPSRHSSPRSTPPSSVDKPVPTVEQGEGKRRRRTKANRAESPLKAEAVLAEALADAPEQAVNASDNSDNAGVAATATPSKSSRRRSGRANRQPSPPLPDASAASGLDQPAPAFPSTTPPRSDFAALAGHSRSVPPDPLSVRQHQYSLADAWDMPAVPQQSSDKPKESLSWQQELLRSGSLNSHSRNGSNGKAGDSPAARTRSRTAKTTSNPQPASNNSKSRPPLTTSVSDFGTSTNPALNWQQEMLLRTDDAQLVQQQSSSSNTSSTLTPARQRRNQIKDSITFGVAGLDLSEDDADVFGSSASTPRRQQQQQRPRAQQSAPVLSTGSTGYSTPVKVVPEARYAGPTFHNSPAPSSLPVPSFLLRRKAEGVAN
ncbi:Proteophosphoglycan ppg4 [Rhodotorula toruloides ATCC 204091]|uniref:Proteophosphoglycan ppg4 n=1 Tax=Rhodotorula toruloides TaxID=5286 RepID=A0A0K3CNP3_RHOTO|nr:Proteophosphoglycan ppg4 [Rhodotorula toruloides ATCC 204091]PRQ70277.1 Proteophosphoglycan ppg4 [Rhodotorula toruloides]